MISATGRISLIPPAVCPADHYRRGRRAQAKATVERGSPNTASPARIGAVKRAMLAIQVTGTAVRLSSILTEYGWLDLAAADRAPPAERELAVYSWVASKGWMPAWLHKASLRDDPSERPRWVKAGIHTEFLRELSDCFRQRRQRDARNS